MEDAVKLGFEFASSLTDLLISLSTGMIALTITFMKDILKTVSSKAFFFFKISWLSLLLSVLCGVWASMALTGSLVSNSGTPTIEFNVRLPSAIQIILFLFGIVFMVVGGIKGIGARVKEAEENK